jgi:hypothetical protein
MQRPLITIQNAQTNEIETREMNDQEFACYETIQLELATEAQAQLQTQAAKAAAQAKLAALGLTTDDLKALGL